MWKKLLIIGDSNSQYGYSDEGKWVSMLSDALQRRCDVINRGFSGYNTNHLRIVLPSLLKEFPVDAICGVILFLGSNDSSKSEIQYVPIEEYVQNMKFMIEYTLKKGVEKSKIIIVAPPRIADEKFAKDRAAQNLECFHYDGLVKKYSERCIQLAKSLDLEVVDFYNLMNNGGLKVEDYLKDGLHLSQAGSKLLFDNLWPIVDKNIVKKHGLNFNLPYWRDIKSLDELKRAVEDDI